MLLTSVMLNWNSNNVLTSLVFYGVGYTVIAEGTAGEETRYPVSLQVNFSNGETRVFYERNKPSILLSDITTEYQVSSFFANFYI